MCPAPRTLLEELPSFYLFLVSWWLCTFIPLPPLAMGVTNTEPGQWRHLKRRTHTHGKEAGMAVHLGGEGRRTPSLRST